MGLRQAEMELATAQTLQDISFYASSTQASEAAKLNIRRFSDNGQCKLLALNEAACNNLVTELNAAIRPVLDRWKEQYIDKAVITIRESGPKEEPAKKEKPSPQWPATHNKVARLEKCIEVLGYYYSPGQDAGAAVHCLKEEILPVVKSWEDIMGRK